MVEWLLQPPSGLLLSKLVHFSKIVLDTQPSIVKIGTIFKNVFLTVASVHTANWATVSDLRKCLSFVFHATICPLGTVFSDWH